MSRKQNTQKVQAYENIANHHEFWLMWDMLSQEVCNIHVPLNWSVMLLPQYGRKKLGSKIHLWLFCSF